MKVLRVLWHSLTRFFGALRSLFGAVIGFVARLLDELLEHPIAALERLAAKVNEMLAGLLDFIAKVWRRIWQRAPAPARDSRTTPGRGAIALLAATTAVALWFLVPVSSSLGLAEWQVVLGLLATWLALLPVFRALLRREPPGRSTLFLIDAARRTGLIRLERLACVCLGAAGVYAVATGHAAAGAAALLLSVGFFVLLGSPLQARDLADELPVPISPEPAPGPEGGDAAAPDGGEAVLRTFRWQVPRSTAPDEMSVTVAVDRDRYERMRSENPGRPTGGSYPDWTPWVAGGVTPEVARVAREIRVLTSAARYSRFDEATAALAFAQSITYALDSDTTGADEYWRYPIETMHDEHGDCEDFSILAATVLRELGHDVLPLVTHDHAAIGIAVPAGMPGTFVEHQGRRYYYCETTGEGFRIGELPPDVDPSRLRACPLVR